MSPGVGGLIISLGRTTAAGASLAYLIDAGSYLASALTLSSVRTPFQAQRTAAPGGRLHRQMAEGLRYIWSQRPLRLLVVVNMLHRMCFAPVQLAVVVLARDRFQADVRTIGLLFSAAGAGGLVASLVTPWLRARRSVGGIMLGLVAGHALALALIAAAPSPAVAMVGMFAGGVMEIMTGIVQVSYRLAAIPDALQGRVHSSYRLFSYGAVTLGVASGGVLLARLGPRLMFWLLAAVMALIALGIAASDARRI